MVHPPPPSLRRRRPRGRPPFVLAVFLVISGCALPGRKPPNILLVTLDTVRADHLGCYGYDRPTTPNLDSLAARSIVFDRAYSQAPWTHPSMSSLHTALHPRDHGVTQWDHVLAPERITLAEVLRSAGYHTEAYVSHVIFDAGSGYAQGFDHYDRTVIEGVDPHLVSTARELTDRVLARLARLPEPHFVWVHYFDPHYAYLSQDEVEFGDEPVDDYDEEIRHTDAQIGRLLAAYREAGWAERTAVVVVADHGEEFGDHGGSYHTQTLYEELIRVPLLIHLPGVVPRRHSTPVAVMDIAPTLVRWLGLQMPSAWKGRPIWDGGETCRSPADPIFVETRRFREVEGVIQDGYKLIAWSDAGHVELFDLETDPEETQDLARLEPDRTAAMLALLRRFYDGSSADPRVRELSREITIQLRSLGYVQ